MVRSEEPYRNQKQGVLNLGSGICDADARDSNVEEKAVSCVRIRCDTALRGFTAAVCNFLLLSLTTTV